MSKRWAWTWPVLSSLATIGITTGAWGQSAGPTASGVLPASGGVPAAAAPLSAGVPPQGYGPPALPAYAQGLPGYAPPGYPAYAPQAIAPQPVMPAGYAEAGAMPAAYAQPPAYPGAMPPGAYVAPPGAYNGAAPQAMPGAMPMPGGMAPDAYGAYGYVPLDGGAGQPMYDPQMMAGGGYPGMYGGPMPADGPCPYCGGSGCEHCGRRGLLGHGGVFGEGHWLHHGLLGDVLALVAPYPDGGCCAPRWFDFAVDFIMLRRDDAGRSVPFTSFGINGPIVLDSNMLDFDDYEPGFRVQANIQLGAANSVEFTYLGQVHYTSTASVFDGSGQLFSVVSQFGLMPFGGFAETDQSDFQFINYSSSLDSFEANWRMRWMSPNCRFQGSWTLGVRHLIIDEKMRYHTRSINTFATPLGPEPFQAEFNVNTTNNLTGFQVGTDLWLCLVPGLRAGGEIQAGVYGNHVNVLTTIGVNDIVSPDNPFTERAKSDDVSFVGQANLMATYRINYHWTARAGYQFIYVEGIGLAVENFNPQPPQLFFPAVQRTPRVNDSGSMFLHGWNAGFEFMW